jgi:hypothetical protein
LEIVDLFFGTSFNFIYKIESERPARSIALNPKDKIKAKHLFYDGLFGRQ